MKCMPMLLLSLAVLSATLSGWWPTPAQDFKAPGGKTPSPAVLQQIADKIAKFDKALAKYRGPQPDQLLPEIEVYPQAAEKIVKYNEFFQPDSAKWTLEVLDRGLERLKQVEDKSFAWLKKPG